MMLIGRRSPTFSAVLKHVHSVMILRLTFGHLQGDERAAQRHGGHCYDVGERCASPGRRGRWHDITHFFRAYVEANREDQDIDAWDKSPEPSASELEASFEDKQPTRKRRS